MSSRINWRKRLKKIGFCKNSTSFITNSRGGQKVTNLKKDLDDLEDNLIYYGFCSSRLMPPEEFELKDIKIFEKFIKKHKEEKRFNTYLQAWVSHIVKTTDEKGNYIYNKFEDFYTPDGNKSSSLNND